MPENKVFDAPDIGTIYERQQGTCHLELEELKDKDGNVVDATLYCCDDEHREFTYNLLNPSHECIKCMVKFFEDFISRRGKIRE